MKKIINRSLITLKPLVLLLTLFFWFNASLLQAGDPALDKYYAANSLYNKGLYKLAIEEYRDFLLKYPTHKKVLNVKLGLALSLFELGEYNKALPIFKELSENKNAPHQSQVHNLLGQCFLIAGKPAEAEKAFRWSVNRGKERFFLELPGVGEKFREAPTVSMATVQDLEPLERSLAGLIEALYQQGKWEDTIKTAGDLFKLVPKGKFTERARFLASLSLYELKKYKEAIKQLKIIIKNKKSPYYEHAYFLFAECKRLLGELNSAAEAYNTVAKNIKGRFTPDALFRLGYIHFLLKHYDIAIKEFSDLRAVYSTSQYVSDAGIYLGRCYLELKKFKEAQSIFGALTDNKRVQAEATLWLAKTFMRQKQYEKAAMILKKAIRKFPEDKIYPKLLFEYANVHMHRAKYDIAASFFRKAGKNTKSPKLEADAMRLTAFCLNRAQKFRESLTVCNQFIKKYPHDPFIEDVKFVKAEDLYFSDNIMEAIKLYRQFIPWEGEAKYSKEARMRIAQCFVRLKKWYKALHELEPLLKSPPKGVFFSQMHYLAGLCSLKLKHYREAMGYFKDFISLHPTEENADIALFNIAAIHITDDNTHKAKENLLKLIKNYPESKLKFRATIELAKLLYGEKNFKEAYTLLHGIIKQGAENKFYPDAIYYAGWIKLAESEINKAQEFFSEIVRNFPKHPLYKPALMQNIIILIKEKKYQQAYKLAEIYEQKASASSEKEQGMFYKAILLARLNKIKKAKLLFDKFIKKYPDSEFMQKALYELAWINRKLKLFSAAQDAYKAILKSAKNDILSNRAAFELAEMLYSAKKYDEAISIMDKLIAQGVSDNLREKIIYRTAWCLIGRKQLNAAAETFEKLIGDYPDSLFIPIAAYQTGEIKLKNKEYEQAYRMFRLAVEKTKNTNKLLKVTHSENIKNDENYLNYRSIREQAILRLGETETLTDRWKDAATTFKVFLEEYPKSKFLRRALLWYAWTQQNLKKYDKAIDYYKKVTAGDVKDELAARSQFQIGECFFSMKNYNQAVKEFVKVEVNYNYPSWTAKALLELGQSLRKLGLKDKAAVQLKKVIKKYPGTDEAVFATQILEEMGLK